MKFQRYAFSERRKDTPLQKVVKGGDACGRLLQDLFNRGLTGKKLQLVIHDGAKGFKEALTFDYPTVSTQPCTVHKVRGLLKYLRFPFPHRTLLRDAAGCFNVPNLFAAKARLRAFIQKWKAIEPKAVAAFCSGLEACFSFYRFPAQLHPRIRSTNLLERFLEEWRRRVKPIRSFADETRRGGRTGAFFRRSTF